jgi:hypothetical protein
MSATAAFDSLDVMTREQFPSGLVDRRVVPEAPLDQTNGRGRVLGEDKHHVVGTKHAHRLLDRCSLIRSLNNNRRNVISGGALAKPI